MSDTPLSGFTKVNDLISIHRPNNASTTPPTSSDPDLIVFCSWMGAAPKHIAKYTSTHRRIYPHTTILLIESTMSSMMVETDLEPAYQVISSVKNCSTTSKQRKLVLHSFSNGGARTASRLATASKDQLGSCPFDTMIFDCCPGTANLSSTARAISISLPDWHMARQLGFVAIYVLAVVFMLVAKVLKWEDSISFLKRTLNDPEMVPVGVPRLYLFSKKDALVDVRDVRAHAEDARVRGYHVVREVEFEKAMHCALVNEDSERYWDAVKEIIEGK